MKSIDLYDLRVGDNFMEDTFSEIYRVVSINPQDGEMIVFAQELGTSNIVRFSYSEQAYAPNIIYLSHS